MLLLLFNNNNSSSNNAKLSHQLVALCLLAATLTLLASRLDGAVIRSASVTSQHDRSVYIDSNIELTCDLTNEYQDDLEWRKMSGRMSDNSVEKGGKLFISGVTLDDEGEYECFTDYGKSSSVRLHVHDIKVTNDGGQQQGNSFEREIDSDIELVCELSEGNENEIKWRKLDGALSEYTREYDGKMLVYYLSYEDSGTYECYLPDGQARRVQLRVIAAKDYGLHEMPAEEAPRQSLYENQQSQPQQPEKTVAKEDINYDKEAELGSNAELRCKYTKSDAGELKWRKLNGNLGQYTREHEGRLFVFYLTRVDDGEYECFLPNGMAQTVRLTITGAAAAAAANDEASVIQEAAAEEVVERREEQVDEPTVSEQQSFDKQVTSNGNAELQCSLTDGNERDLKWRKVGAEPNAELANNIRSHFGKIYIYYANRENSGEYECYLDDGRTSRVRLTVIDDETTSGEEKETNANDNNSNNKNYDQEAELNSNVELDCELSSGNGNSLEWKKHDGEMSSYAREYLGKLYIYYVSTKDSGDYECRLPDGTSRTVRLLVRGSEEATTTLVKAETEVAVDSLVPQAANSLDIQDEDGASARDVESGVADSLVINAANFDEIADVDSNVVLSCLYTIDHADVLEWKKLDGTMTHYSRVIDGKLHLYYLKESDGGQYECSLPDGRLNRVNLVVKPTRQSGEQSIEQDEVNEENSSLDPAFARANEYESNDKTAQVNSNVQLSCYFTSEHGHDLKWRKLDGKLSDYAREYNGKLEINYLKETDSGIYECFVEGTDKLDSVKLTVTSDDSVLVDEYTDQQQQHQQQQQQQQQYYHSNAENGIDENFDKQANLNENTELSCKYSSDNEVKWRRQDGQKLSDYSREYEGNLQIYYISEAEAGVYECYLPSGQASQVRLSVSGGEKQQEGPGAVAEQPSRSQYEQQRYEEPRREEEETNARRNDVEREPGYAVRAYVSKTRIEMSESSNEEVTCVGLTNAVNEGMTIDWYDSRGQQISNGNRVQVSGASVTSEEPLTKESKLFFSGVSSELIGTIECRVVVGLKTESARFEVTGSSSSSSSEHQAPAAPVDYRAAADSRSYDEAIRLSHSQNNPRRRHCNADQATCRNGECIPRSSVCDGRNDCSDGTDESSCSNVNTDPNRCQPNERACRSSGKCIQKIWFCDGEQECDDASDEENCPASLQPGQTCRSNEFECRSRTQCVWMSFVCDGESDCADGSDETGCELPRYVRSPTRNVQVRVGETFTLDCEAAGFPAPLINWRLNWGHICSEPRCRTTSENGRGTLTVTDAQPSDAGAYSCEAINNQGFEFIGPDAIVEVITGYEQPQPQPPQPEPPREEERIYNPCGYHNPCGEPEPETTTREEINPCGYHNPCGEPEPETTTREEINPCGYVTPGSPCGYEEETTTPEPRIENPCGYAQPESHCSCNGHSETCDCAGICYDCQHNTEGDKCERCKPGFYGDATRGTPYDCEPRIENPCGYAEPVSHCSCNGHSETCDCNGNCYDCRDNTAGNKCEYCLPGFYGDATRGTPYDCQPRVEEVEESNPCGREPESDCQCNNHSDQCSCGGHCIRCQHNTEGDKCERCMPGFYGDATRGTPYDCVAINQPAPMYSSQEGNCDPDGTARQNGHHCRCKSGVTGAKCDQCAARHFKFVRNRPANKPSRKGCLACFCNGLSVDCRSSNLRYMATNHFFESGSDGWKVSDKFTKIKEEVTVVDNGIEFSNFYMYPDAELYFIPSYKFGGNRLASYGGFLNFTVEYEGIYDDFKQLEVRISGNRINIYHVHDQMIMPGQKHQVTIQLYEDEFKRYGDNGRVDRDHFLMALTSVDLIMIRANLVRTQSKVRLSEISIERGENVDYGRSADYVEVCECPAGYTGASCEECAPGYRRATMGFYLGLCEPSF